MKTPPPFITKSVAAATAAGVLLPSCVGYNFDDSYYGPHADNLPQGHSFYSLGDSNLSEEFINRLNAIQQIVNTIIADGNEARLFAENPDEYLASKESHFNITLLDPEKKLLFAISDEDVLNAIRTNDIHSFLSLCNERGYLGIINEYNKPDHFRSYFKTDKDYEEFIEFVKYVGGDIAQTRSALAGVVALLVAGVAIFMGAAVVYAAEVFVVGHMDVMAAQQVVVWTEGMDDEEVDEEVANETMELFVNEPTLRLWTQNNGLISSDVFYSEMIDKQLNMFMEIIEQDVVMDPDTADAVRQILRIQLEGYYGLRN